MKKAFTLVELLVVISIVGVLSSVVSTSVNSARTAARESKAVSDMEAIYKAMLIMNVDTEKFPNNLSYLCEPLDQISNTNEFAVSVGESGLVTNGRSWDGWKGPYISGVPTDPWGNEYYFDDDYECLSETQGCSGIDDDGDLNSSVIASCGPNAAISSGACAYDADNIVRVLCKR